LTIRAPDEPYQLNSAYYLYVGLKNHESLTRTLHEMTSTGALSASRSLSFRIEFDDSTSLNVRNRPEILDDRRPEVPLEIDGYGMLVGAVDFNELVVTSGALFRRIQASRLLIISAMVADLECLSNEITVKVGGSTDE
jgi:hypothetical protein